MAIRPVDFGEHLQWEVIDDFSKGIISQGYGKNSAQIKVPAPLGSARDIGGTFACIALPQGGLGPLPDVSNAPFFPLTTGSGQSAGHTTVITGAACYGPVIDTGVTLISPTDRLYFSLEQDDGVHRLYALCSMDMFNALTPQVNVTAVSTNDRPVNSYWGTSWDYTMLQAGTVPISASNIVPTIATEWASLPSNVFNPFAPVGTVWLVPSVSAPTTAFQVLGGGVGVTSAGPIVAHQGRIVELQAGGHGAGTATAVMIGNNQYQYTDPAGTAFSFGFQGLFDFENPAGYGAWGSQSAGELLLVKRYGGAAVISGDIANPFITRLPAVQSTGAFKMAGLKSRIGMLYCTDGQGIWAWDGGNTSTKISQQIDDKAFGRNDFTFQNVQMHACLWNQLAVFPTTNATNSLVYDLVTNSWWRLGFSGNTRIYVPSVSSVRYIYGFSGSFVTSASNGFQRFDSETLSNSYGWESNPLPFTVQRLVTIEEVAVVISANSIGVGSAEVAININDDSGATVASVANTVVIPTTASGYEVAARFPIRAQGTNLTVQVICTNTTSTSPAPYLRALAIGYETNLPLLSV